jgi:hypothetical protein
VVGRIAVLLLMLACAAVGTNAHAAVSAQLSAQSIDELETVRLGIKITDTRQTQALDLSALEKDFHVMNTSTASRSQFLNGRGQSWVDYQITLQPKRTGTLTIPSIAVGNQRTPTLELKVHPLSAQTRQKIDELVFFENTVSASTIYVQSQLILTRRLLYSQGVQLYSDLPGAPEIADAVVLSLGETSSGTTQRHGKPYGVVEQQYAIFPETSGTFTVPGISITASVRLIEGNRVSRKGVRVGTSDEQITVLPVPAIYPADQPWLPAIDVTLFDVVSPGRPEHQVGDTLTHELFVHIEGNIGSISPPLTLSLSDKDYRLYPQAPTIEDDTTSSTVRGSRLQTTAIVPLIPGQLRLPVSELYWWDTLNNEVRISRTILQTLNVTGQAVVPVLVEEDAEPIDAALPEINTNEMPWGFTWQSLLPYVLGTIGVFVVLASMLGLARLIGKWRTLRSRKPNVQRQLQQAFTSADGKLIHHALAAYLVDFYRCPSVQAFTRFSDVSDDTKAAVEALNRHLYAGGGAEMQLPSAAITQLRASVAQLAPRVMQRVNPLPDLYPQTLSDDFV